MAPLRYSICFTLYHSSFFLAHDFVSALEKSFLGRSPFGNFALGVQDGQTEFITFLFLVSWKVY